MNEAEIRNIIDELRLRYLDCINKNQHSYAQSLHNEIDRWEERLQKMSNKRQAELFESEVEYVEAILDPLTEMQAKFLAARGYDAHALSQMSKQQAQQLIGEIKESESSKPDIIDTSVKTVLANEFRKLCKEPLCGRKAQARGMCHKHYQSWRKQEMEARQQSSLKGGE